MKGQGAAIANDIAVIYLQTPFEPNDNVQFLTLPPNTDYNMTGRRCTITGWGRTCNYLTLLFLLIIVTLVERNEYCKKNVLRLYVKRSENQNFNSACRAKRCFEVIYINVKKNLNIKSVKNDK